MSQPTPNKTVSKNIRGIIKKVIVSVQVVNVLFFLFPFLIPHINSNLSNFNSHKHMHTHFEKKKNREKKAFAAKLKKYSRQLETYKCYEEEKRQLHSKETFELR